MRTRSLDAGTLEPIEPTHAQILHSALSNWEYDKDTWLFSRGDKIGYFTLGGFYVL